MQNMTDHVREYVYGAALTEITMVQSQMIQI